MNDEAIFSSYAGIMGGFLGLCWNSQRGSPRRSLDIDADRPIPLDRVNRIATTPPKNKFLLRPCASNASLIWRHLSAQMFNLAASSQPH
jgi:hypothetical protein